MSVNVFETERLIFREFSKEDVCGFFDLNNDPIVIKYTGDTAFKNKQEVLAFIESYSHYKAHGYGRWSVYLKESQKYIGFCGLRCCPISHEVDLGFRFQVDSWNNGYATEAAMASLDVAFNRFELVAVIARTMRENLVSQVVLKKIGMKLDSEFVENDVIWLKHSLSKDDYLKKCK